MYHSPGLRDGVSSQGTRVRPCPPEVLGAESILTRFAMAGNKFGWPRVPLFGWSCALRLFERESGEKQGTFFELRDVGLFCERLNRLLSPAV